ncbi:hypothetical protein ACFRFJ_15725 [Streptomyces hydrogenans]|uniref:hypothetical protein n=1 Tax=Streptomyces hydrogenans TaxID=1873719 RepID=UPI0036AE44A1
MTTRTAFGSPTLRPIPRPTPGPPPAPPDPLASAFARAITRDCHLTAAEAEAWQQSRAESKTPKDTTRPFDAYLPLLRRFHWRIETGGDHRLEAVHRSGARIMLTTRRDRYGVRRYVLLPPGEKSPRWHQVSSEAVTEFIRVRRLPRGTAARIPHTVCHCKKRRYVSEYTALQYLVEAKLLRHLHRDRKRRECRAYRCPTDPRVWHLTSWATGPDSPAPAPPAPKDNAQTADATRGGVTR